MKSKILFWLPRVLGVLLILFVSLFALDVFAGQNLGQELLALLIHLIPSYLLVAALVLAWKKPKAGAVAYAALAVLGMIFSKSSIVYALPILLPTLLVAILFWLQPQSSPRR